MRNGGLNTQTESIEKLSIHLPAPDAENHSQHMETASESIALITVILRIGLEEMLHMSEKQFQAEKLYYISVSIAKSMLEKGVIDRELFAVIDTKLLEKYRPISAVLLSGNSLT